MKRLSIVIVTYNSEADIFDCVDSIKTSTDIPLSDLELIIVDNCSREPDAMFSHLRQQWGDDIVCINNDRNGGYGQGNNVGIRAASAPIVLIMNPDVRLPQAVFSSALQTFCDNADVALLGMKQLYAGNKPSGRSFFPTWLIPGYLRPVLLSICNRLDWYWPSCMYIQGSCFFLRKAKFEEVGMFDESNFMYGEEEDIHYRLKKEFSSRCFTFDRKLSYIHLAQDREPSLQHNQKLLEADLRLYAKKGVDLRMILRHYWQNYRLLLWKSSLCRTSSVSRSVFQQFFSYLKKQLNS